MYRERDLKKAYMKYFIIIRFSSVKQKMMWSTTFIKFCFLPIPIYIYRVKHHRLSSSVI